MAIFELHGRGAAKHEDHPYHGRTHADAGAEKLNDVHNAIDGANSAEFIDSLCFADVKPLGALG
jgi:hypothetical protein